MDPYWTLGSWPGFDPPEGVTASVASLRLAGPAYATTPTIWYHRKGITADLTSDPKGYRDLLALLTARIRAAQLRASITVNQELLLLYWGIGKKILTRQRDDGWGTKVIERLANDLRREFPEMQGLSPRNLGYMKAFADAWPDEAILQAPLAKLT
jgi:hypothetical protein